MQADLCHYLLFILVAPSNKPSLLTCHTTIIGGNGEKKRTHGSACENLTDFYGNYQPELLVFTIDAAFKVNTSSFKSDFIQESKFGVADATVKIQKEPVQGIIFKFQPRHQKT